MINIFLYPYLSPKIPKVRVINEEKPIAPRNNTPINSGFIPMLERYNGEESVTYIMPILLVILDNKRKL